MTVKRIAFSVRLCAYYSLVAHAAVNEGREALARSAHGDQAAFAMIVREHQGMVFSMAYHFLRDRWLAEELAQFERPMPSMDEYDLLLGGIQ